jgi:hypothetical protein
MELENFIKQLEGLQASKKSNQIIPHIKNVKGFLSSLKRLSSMIGMKEFKNNIVSQIKYYFLNQVRLGKDKKNNDTHMFHTVLLGPPGSGKTTAAEILADIWMDLGLLKPDLTLKLQSSTTSSSLPFFPSQDIPVIQSEQYKKLVKEKELLVSLNSNVTRDLTDSKIKLTSITHELITEKKKVDNLREFFDSKKINITPEISKILHRKLISLESGYEYIIKKYIHTPNPFIPFVKQEDYESSDEEDKIYSKKQKLSEFEKVYDDDDNSSSGSFSSYGSTDVSKFIKLRRDDLVGKYIGHTAIKTREALMTGLGKVIFIDEAYELYNVTTDSSSDCFGMECLSAILNFMNEFSDRSIIIFAGYEDLLKKTIFRVQPGLERRIAWTFTLNAYNEEELVNIYEKQLSEKAWNLKDKDKVLKLFKEHKTSFKHGGGDTLRLAMYTKTVYSDICFELLIQNKEITSCITYDIVSKALNILKDTTDNQKTKDIFSSPPENMYV